MPQYLGRTPRTFAKFTGIIAWNAVSLSKVRIRCIENARLPLVVAIAHTSQDGSRAYTEVGRGLHGNQEGWFADASARTGKMSVRVAACLRLMMAPQVGFVL